MLDFRKHLKENFMPLAMATLGQTPVKMRDPQGKLYETINGTTDPLLCEYLSDRQKLDDAGGDVIIVADDRITLSEHELERIPKAGEPWVFMVAIDPSEPTVFTTFAMGGKPPQNGNSIGFIQIFLGEVKQV